MRRATRRQLLGLAVGGGLLLAAALVLSPDALLGELEGLAANPLLFAVTLTAVYLFRPLVAWPISAVSVLVGYVYGVELGLPIALLGAVLTCVPPYLVARAARTDDGVFGWLRRSGERVVAATGPTRGILAARLAPVPADAVSYGAGLSTVPATAFLTGTFLGEIPWVTAAVLAGSSMRTLTVRGLESNLTLLVGAASLSVLVVAGPAYRHLRDELPGSA